jgi:S1-C subfamily serine protease
MPNRADLSRLAEILGGLPILGCLEGSPAAVAGVRCGDILLAINGKPTSTWTEFIEARREKRGWLVARIFRDGTVMEFAIETRPSDRSPMELMGEVMAQSAVVDGAVAGDVN